MSEGVGEHLCQLGCSTPLVCIVEGSHREVEDIANIQVECDFTAVGLLVVSVLDKLVVDLDKLVVDLDKLVVDLDEASSVNTANGGGRGKRLEEVTELV
jgi:hypothetical protein